MSRTDSIAMNQRNVDVAIIGARTAGLGARRDAQNAGKSLPILLPIPHVANHVERLVREGLGAMRRRRPSHIAGAMNRWIARIMPRRALGWIFSTMLRRNAAKHLLPGAY